MTVPRQKLGQRSHAAFLQWRAPIGPTRWLPPGLLLACLVACVRMLAQPFPSYLLDSTRVVSLDAANAHGTQTAICDTVALAVWYQGSGGIRGCRVSRSGVLLDPVCFDVTGPLHSAQSSKLGVAGSGQGFLVVWWEHGVYGCLVSAHSEILGRFPIDAIGGTGVNPTVAFDGTNYLVVWCDSAGGVESAKYARVSASGVVLDPPRRLSPYGSQADISLASGTRCYLAVFNQGDGTWGVRVSHDGTLLDTLPFPVPGHAKPGARVLTFSGKHFVVAYTERQATADNIVMSRIAEDGTVVDPSGVVVAGAIRIGTLAGTACNGTTLLTLSVLSDSSQTVSALRMDDDLHVLDTGLVTLSSEYVGAQGSGPSGLSAVATGSGYLVAWTVAPAPDYHARSRRAVCRRLTEDGLVIDTSDVALSQTANSQMETDVASDGRDFLAVWTDLRPDTAYPERVRAIKFRAPRAVADSTSFPVGPPGSYWPAIAYGRGVYLVCGADEMHDIWAVRVSTSGAVLDSSPIRMTRQSVQHEPKPDVAFCDSVFLVVWDDHNDILGARVNAAGQVLDTVPISIMPASGLYVGPWVAGDDISTYLVTFYNWSPNRLEARKVSTAGVVLGTTSVKLSRGRTSPNVAYGGGVYLAVDGEAEEAWRLWADTSLLDTVDYRLGACRSHPALGFNGTNFLIADHWLGDYMLAGVRISPDGEVLDHYPVVLTRVDSSVQYLVGNQSMAADSIGNVALTFFSCEPFPYFTSRLRAATFRHLGVAETPAPGFAREALVYPNPTRDNVQYVIDVATSRSIRIELHDAAGRNLGPVYAGAEPAGRAQLWLDLGRRPPGVYFLSQVAKGEMTRIVIQR